VTVLSGSGWSSGVAGPGVFFPRLACWRLEHGHLLLQQARHDQGDLLASPGGTQLTLEFGDLLLEGQDLLLLEGRRWRPPPRLSGFQR
jgi:hypothetical protein